MKWLTLAFLFAASAASAQGVARFENVSVTDVVETTRRAKPAKWTFDDCLAWSVENSTNVREALLNVLLADEEVGAAKDAWLPTVSFGTSQSFTNFPSPAAGRDANSYGSTYNVNAGWTVWEGNVRKYRLESARIARNRMALAGEDVVKDITLGILQAYLDIMYAKEAVEIAKATLEVSDSQKERAKALMESGRTSSVEYAQIESQAAQDGYNLVQAESNLATARLNLKKILNLSLDEEIEIADVNFPDSEIAAVLPPKGDVFTYASGWLPQFGMNDLNREIYANDIKIAKAGALPSIQLQGGIGTGYSTGGAAWTSQMGHGFNESLGLSLSVPIYDGNSTRRAVAKAKLASLEYDINRDRLLDELSNNIESLYIDAETARARYASGETQLEATELTARLVDRQFELGKVNPVDLLVAHNNLLSARLGQLQNKYMAILANKTIEYYATRWVAMP